MNEPDKAPRAPQGSAPLVFAAVAVGGLGIGFGIAATILMVRSQKATPVPSASQIVLPAPEPGPAPPPSGPWIEELHAEHCAAPCCGGEDCRVSAENSGKNLCKKDGEFCESCVSAISCVPGSCGATFDGSEEVALHLSAIVERDPSGKAQDACKTQRDLWLCVRRTADSEWQCLSQREACSNKNRSPAGIFVTGAELLRENLSLEVREGSPDGETLAHREGALQRGGLQRRFMCGGFRSEFDAGPIIATTYFLDSRSSDTLQPTRVAKRPPDAGDEAGVAPSASAPEPAGAPVPAAAGSAAPQNPL